jgi:uncharacterized protein YndB with AHSA1/START domain
MAFKTSVSCSMRYITPEGVTIRKCLAWNVRYQVSDRISPPLLRPGHDLCLESWPQATPKAAVDSVSGTLLAIAEVSGTPEQTFRALITSEVEKWWTIPGVYHLKDWNADLRVQGRWSVTVELNDGKQLNEWGEFCALEVPNKIVMTRRFGANPLLGDRETTLTYQLQPSANGTLITLREEGFMGRAEAAYGNAENWEKVLGWLDDYLSQK